MQQLIFGAKLDHPNSHVNHNITLEGFSATPTPTPAYYLDFWECTGGIEIEGKGTGGYKALPYAGQNAVGVSILADATNLVYGWIHAFK